jgi:3,4-dihydroxy 2-butanone 4-phosphate synthase / GTP cyclohydrolase II
MARVPDLVGVAAKFNLKIVTVKDIIQYRIMKEKLVEKITDVNFPTKHGKFKLHLYETYLMAENK